MDKYHQLRSTVHDVATHADPAKLLALLCDSQWLHNPALQLALLHDLHIISHLLDHPDPYVQFVVQRLLNELMINPALSSTRDDNGKSDSELVLRLRRELLHRLLQQLVHPSSHRPEQQKRTVLELFHALFKHHRHLIRSQQDILDQERIKVEGSRREHVYHIALDILREISTTTLTAVTFGADFWTSTINQLLETDNTQYAALVFLIDLEKARHLPFDAWSLNGSLSSSPPHLDHPDIEICHRRIVENLDFLVHLPRFQSTALRKLLELLSLTLWKSTSTTGSLSMNETASVANTAPQQLVWQLKLPIQILALLSPIMLQVFISFRDTDPDLEQLLKVGTTFILCRAAEERPTGTNQTNGSHLIHSLLTNTEAMRQLGRVMLTATLSILETLGDLHDRQLYQDNPVSFDSESESDLASLLKVLQDFLPELISFIRTWVGPRTIKTLLTVFGEDDSGFSWLLTVMIRIQLQLDKLRSQHMVNLGLCPPNSKSDNGVDTSSRPSTWRVLGGAFTYSEIMEDLYDHLHNHAHPLEMLFSFLETIGYDYQTFLDLLLTPDEKNESSGMLAAVMAVLRAFTERLPDQQRLLERWKQTIHGEDEDEDEGDIEAGKMSRENCHEDYADDEQDTDNGTDIDTDSDFTRGSALSLISTRAHLFNVDFCLSQLASRIRRLHQSNLFPYNPRPLLVVLDRTQNLLSMIVGE